jgi:hypothetical protein
VDRSNVRAVRVALSMIESMIRTNHISHARAEPVLVIRTRLRVRLAELLVTATQRVTPEFDIGTAGKGMSDMTFRLGNVLRPFICQNAFASFFSSRFTSFVLYLQSNTNSASPYILCPHIPPRFDVFHPATFAEISKHHRIS